jgi:protocatechuate 3,4-dioxygenase beta subunit
MPRRSAVLCCSIAGLLLAAASGVGRAQVVHGVVVDANARPIPGVVVLLVDSASQVAARALTDARGLYRLSAPRPASYRLRTLRIGYRPVVSPPIALETASDVTRRLELTGLPISLDTIRVVDRSVCRAFTDSGAATYAVWEQIRTALTAAQLTAASRTLAVSTVAFERTVGARPGIDDRTLLAHSASLATGYVTQPWRAVGGDTLQRLGYLLVAPDNSVLYFAPDLDVLLSAMFVEDHCFRIVRDRKHGGQLGIAFEPVPDRRRVAEIRGTLWLDAASSELRSLEFRYVNVPTEQQDDAGGDIAFVRLRDGSWTISQWGIHMPVLQQIALPGRPAEIRVGAIETTGGELAMARRDNDTLWTGRRFTLEGDVLDSSSGDGLPGARVRLAESASEATTDAHGRFAIAGVLPGRYQLEVHTPWLDSLATSRRVPISFVDGESRVEVRVPSARQVIGSICGASGSGRADGGILIGRAALRDSAVAANVLVTAEWSARTNAENSDAPDTAAIVTRRIEVRAGSNGAFRACGLPLDTELRLHASADSAETANDTTIRIPATGRIAHANLTLDPLSALASRGAVFVGIVVADSTRRPIAGAEVALPELGKSVLTDARGEFRITGIAAGEQHVLVRRIGYGAADARVAFNGNETVERRVVLGRAVTLEPVIVTDRAFERAMASFDEHRHVGLGHFMTRVELSKYTGMKLGSVLEQLPGIDLRHGQDHGTFVSSRRVPPAICPQDEPRRSSCRESHGYYVEGEYGAPVACYSLVWIDGFLVNGSREPTEPFDVDRYAPQQIEAVEFYAGAAETPLEYSKMGSSCGVLVIWTRRE